MKRTYYDILKVEKFADEKTIKSAYIKLQKKYHPDIYNGDKKYAQRVTCEINNAYSVLSDANKRKEYDLSLNFEKESFTDNKLNKKEFKESKINKKNIKKTLLKELKTIDLAILVNIIIILILIICLFIF